MDKNVLHRIEKDKRFLVTANPVEFEGQHTWTHIRCEHCGVGLSASGFLQSVEQGQLASFYRNHRLWCHGDRDLESDLLAEAMRFDEVVAATYTAIPNYTNVDYSWLRDYGVQEQFIYRGA